jgi:hypothetical protein
MSGPGLNQDIVRVIGVIENNGLVEDKARVQTTFLPGLLQKGEAHREGHRVHLGRDHAQ